MTNGLSFSYILAWLRKTPGGKARRAWWTKKDYIFIETRPDGGKDVWGMSDTDEGLQKHPFSPHSSDLLSNDWSVF